MRDNGIELRHLRIITGEHIGLVPDQALYEHLREAHPCDAVVVNTGSEEAVYTIQRYPLTMVSTDTAVTRRRRPSADRGQFPALLRQNGRRARRTQLGTGPFITRRSSPRRQGFSRKGRIRTGMDADLLVFNPETIRDRADFPRPRPPGRPLPEGIRFVIVSGEVAAENGRATGVMAGKAMDSFDSIYPTHSAKAGD